MIPGKCVVYNWLLLTKRIVRTSVLLTSVTNYLKLVCMRHSLLKTCILFSESAGRVEAFESAWGNFSTSPARSARPVTGYGARSASLWAHRSFLWLLSRDRNLHGSGMVTASPKPSFRALWRVGNTMVGRGNVGWTTSKSGYSCPYWNFLHRPPAEKPGRGSLLNCLSCPPDNPVGQGTELSNHTTFKPQWTRI